MRAAYYETNGAARQLSLKLTEPEAPAPGETAPQA